MQQFFDKIPADDLTLLARLPVRVGYWISEVDETGGADARKSERDTINTIITAYAEDYLKSEFVQRLMERTVEEQSAWPAWIVHLDRVPQECARAIKILEGHLSPRDLNVFKQNLLDIGIAVAMAFSEAEVGKRDHPVVRIFKILVDGFRTPTPDERISVIEYRALRQMATAMGLNSAILNSGR